VTCPSRPIYHQPDHKIEAHIFVSFVALLFAGGPEAMHQSFGTGTDAMGRVGEVCRHAGRLDQVTGVGSQVHRLVELEVISDPT
jgi:hypothetical protein